MDAAAKQGNMRKVEIWHVIAICMQGVRIAIPAALILAIGAAPISSLLNSMPAWLTDGLAIGGGMVVAVGYAMVISMAILCNRFCISNCFTNYTYRTWCNRCCFSSCLLGTF